MTVMIKSALARYTAYSNAQNVISCARITLRTCNCLKREALRGKGTSSHEWLTRQFKDPYVEKAKIANYRCRSAFKLLEINQRYKILSPGYCVIDCGASPGSWTQIAVEKTNADGKNENVPKGLVIGIDRTGVYPIEGATIICHDFTHKEAQQKIVDLLSGRKANVILSDMAPNASGVREMDHDNIIKLAYSALRFSILVSDVKATFLVKLWDGRGRDQMIQDLNRFYSVVKIVKPPSSRGDSAEVFLLARDFKGLKT